MFQHVYQKVLDDIQKSPTSFHAVQTIQDTLIQQGYQQLHEEKKWTVLPGGKYYVIRNGSSVIAFQIPKKPADRAVLIASHSDSPCLKVKPLPEIRDSHENYRINMEEYGGLIEYTWLDRPLSVAGRILIEETDGIREKLFDLNRDLLMIPSLAIHMNRKVNEEASWKAQEQLLPFFGQGLKDLKLINLIAEEAQIPVQKILGSDIFVYCRSKSSVWGANNEFMSSPRLDDLECVFGTLQGFINAEPEQLAIYAVFDNEEVGSRTKQGADSTFLSDVLYRLLGGLGCSEEEIRSVIAKSFMVSADNAHASHPGYSEKNDPVNQPQMNGGVVIKYHAGQKYTTDGVSAAILKKVCRDHQIPLQEFVNRTGLPGGSTLGNLSNAHVSLNTADIGLAQLAMHAAYETAGTKDPEYLAQLAKALYETKIPDIMR